MLCPLVHQNGPRALALQRAQRGGLHSKEIVTHRTTGNINAQSVCKLPASIRERYPHIVITLIMDNERYQRCELGREQVPRLAIELHFLPVYCLPLDRSQSGRLSPLRSGCPNLNLIERLWKLVKKRCLTNRYYPIFTDFRHSIDDCLNALNPDHTIESM